MVSKNFPELNNNLGLMMKKLAAEIPGIMGGFSELNRASVADGALGSRTKELIALAIGIAVRCDGCISFHVDKALRAGASRDEITETIGVAIMMGGGPSVVYGSEAMEALEQFEQLNEASG